MSDKRLTCTTRVRLVIDVRGSGPYGMEWKLADLMKQSREETTQGVMTLLQRMGVRVIGEPEVIATIWEKGDDAATPDR